MMSEQDYLRRTARGSESKVGHCERCGVSRFPSWHDWDQVRAVALIERSVKILVRDRVGNHNGQVSFTKRSQRRLACGVVMLVSVWRSALEK